VGCGPVLKKILAGSTATQEHISKHDPVVNNSTDFTPRNLMTDK
jgi:hypothetical protein